MTIQLQVPHMACSACGDVITKAIKAIDPIATVQTDPKTKQVNVKTRAAEATIKQVMIDAGYPIA